MQLDEPQLAGNEQNICSNCVLMDLNIGINQPGIREMPLYDLILYGIIKDRGAVIIYFSCDCLAVNA